tara:strand:+ start:1601 stop:2776 length:1176 start_codon:yes stop_codon:yes gene_type:complete
MRFYLLVASKFLSSNSGVGRFTGIISKLGIAVGSFALVIAISVLNGFEMQVNKKIRDFDGDFKVSGLGLDEDLLIFESIDEIEMISPNRERRGLISFDSKSKVVLFKEVDIDILEKFYRIPIIGIYPTKDQILIGYDIASRLGIKVGDEIIISSPIDQTFMFGFAPSLKIQVSGLFQSRILDYDDRVSFISKDIGSKLFHKVSQNNFIDIRTKYQYKNKDLKKKISQLFDSSIKIDSWEDRHATLVKAMKLEKIGSIIGLSLIILVASFNMVATLSLINIKKIKDIGILRVLGAKVSDLRIILFFQALIIGGRGAFFGLLIGVGLVYMQNIFSFIKLPSDIYAMDSLPMILSINDVLFIILICFCFIIFPGWISGKKVSDFNLIEALKWGK